MRDLCAAPLSGLPNSIMARTTGEVMCTLSEPVVMMAASTPPQSATSMPNWGHVGRESCSQGYLGIRQVMPQEHEFIQDVCSNSTWDMLWYPFYTALLNPSTGRYFPLKYLFGTCLITATLYLCQYVAKRWRDLKKYFWRCCTNCYRTGRG